MGEKENRQDSEHRKILNTTTELSSVELNLSRQHAPLFKMAAHANRAMQVEPVESAEARAPDAVHVDVSVSLICAMCEQEPVHDGDLVCCRGCQAQLELDDASAAQAECSSTEPVITDGAAQAECSSTEPVIQPTWSKEEAGSTPVPCNTYPNMRPA